MQLLGSRARCTWKRRIQPRLKLGKPLKTAKSRRAEWDVAANGAVDKLRRNAPQGRSLMADGIAPARPSSAASDPSPLANRQELMLLKLEVHRLKQANLHARTEAGIGLATPPAPVRMVNMPQTRTAIGNTCAPSRKETSAKRKRGARSEAAEPGVQRTAKRLRGQTDPAATLVWSKHRRWSQTRNLTWARDPLDADILVTSDWHSTAGELLHLQARLLGKVIADEMCCSGRPGGLAVRYASDLQQDPLYMFISPAAVGKYDRLHRMLQRLADGRHPSVVLVEGPSAIRGARTDRLCWVAGSRVEVDELRAVASNLGLAQSAIVTTAVGLRQHVAQLCPKMDGE